MKKLRIILLLLLISVFESLYSQCYTVEKCAESVGDLTAKTNPRVDGNGDPCALLIVRVSDEITSVEGNVVGSLVNKGFEKWVYLTTGSKQVRLLFRNHLTMDILFTDYDFKSVEANHTYILTLSESSGLNGSPDTGGQYLVMTVTPKMAVVHIDSNLQALDSDGTLLARLPYGDHTYTVESQGYKQQSGRVTIGRERVNLPITLLSTMAVVTVSCPTPQSMIYVNEEKRGMGSWTGSLPAGSYIMEARKSGYRSISQSVTLSENERRDVNLPSLQAIVGSMDVSYKPANAEVLIDGTKIGTSPDIFSNIMVGSHVVEVRKSGYESARQTVEIKDNVVTNVTGSLKPETVSSANASFSGSSSSAGGNIETFTVHGVSFNMVKVSGGTFKMGATSEQGSDAYNDEKPVHSVTLSDYLIGETEVTQALWHSVMGNNPSYSKGDNKPVEEVSWDDCQTFISKLSSLTGKKFSLPTEAQWEYASRGGNKSGGYKYSGSNEINDVAWYDGNSGNSTHDVKTKSANELGLYDMTGNVWEWCSDRYSTYSSDSQTNPTGPDAGSNRVDRGGSWNDYAGGCRMSYRDNSVSDDLYGNLGMRLALSE